MGWILQPEKYLSIIYSGKYKRRTRKSRLSSTHTTYVCVVYVQPTVYRPVFISLVPFFFNFCAAYSVKICFHTSGTVILEPSVFEAAAYFFIRFSSFLYIQLPSYVKNYSLRCVQRGFALCRPYRGTLLALPVHAHRQVAPIYENSAT